MAAPWIRFQFPPLAVDHSTIARWVLHYAPVLNERIRAAMRRPNGSWQLDETYLRVAGQWVYLYRAIDRLATPSIFLLSPKQDLVAAKGFLQLAVIQAGSRLPRVINVDGHPAYPTAINALKRTGLTRTPQANRQKGTFLLCQGGDILLCLDKAPKKIVGRTGL